MISKNRRGLVVIVTIVFVFAVLLFVVAGMDSKVKEYEKQVSLVVYGVDSSRWENLRRGAEDACAEYSAELSVVNTTSENDALEQISIIEREIDNGADAILIVPCDSDVIGNYFNNKRIRIPVVFLENEATGCDDECIASDDYNMGKALGEAIVESENPIVKVAIVCDDTIRNSVRAREKGLRDALEGNVNSVVTWERNDNETNVMTRVFLQRQIVSEAVDVVVTLDNEATDSLMDALINLNKKTKVYAISTSDKSVFYLDQERIKALQFQTEYSIGYIGATYLFDKKEAMKEYSDGITYGIVTKGDMYDKDNQTMLFPFVK